MGRHGARRLLIIEPDRDITTVLRLILEARGYEVRLAYSDGAGLAAAREDAFSAVLTDSFYGRAGEMIPASDDPWAWIDLLRGAVPDTPIVLVTAHGEHLFAGYESHGCAALLTKPFGMDALLATLRRCAGDPDERAASPSGVG